MVSYRRDSQVVPASITYIICDNGHPRHRVEACRPRLLAGIMLLFTLEEVGVPHNIIIRQPIDVCGFGGNAWLLLLSPILV